MVDGVAYPSGGLNELQRKTAELQAVLRALPDLFFRFDTEGRFLDFSAPLESQLYASPALFLGKRPAEVMPATLAEMMERTRVQTLETGSLVTYEYELMVGGTLQYFEARYVPFLEGQTIALVRNVTERRQAELALRASEMRLRESQKIEAVGRLAGGVAHDFNNLLMIIFGTSSAIARQITADHPIAGALDEIRKAGQRANALTKQLLALTRNQPVMRRVLDLGEVLREMHSMLGRVIGESVVLRTSVAPGLANIWADRSQMEQVVLNLALNARDAMPHGGELSIRAARGALELDGAPGNHVELSVRDTGSGMSVETQERMFDPFFTTKMHGTGLGLFTVQQIARESGGTVRVSSQLGAGTCVTLRLPAVDRSSEPMPVEIDGALPRGSEVVLVAEDDAAVRTLLVEQLEQLGYTVISASSGTEALEMLSVGGEKVDLLLTDVIMPGISGWELGARLALVQPDCRVLYMSGHALEGESGGEPCRSHLLLSKPFMPETLAVRIRDVLDRRG